MRPAPCPRTRTDAFADRAPWGFRLSSPGVVGGGVVPPGPEPVDVVVGSVGSGGTVTGGCGSDGVEVVTQPTTGRQSCGAAETVFAARRPAAKTPVASGIETERRIHLGV